MSSDLGFIHHYTPSMNGSQRVLLVLHGTGGDENSLVPIAKIIDENAAILSVRGKVLENGAARFFRRLAEGVFDLPDLHARTAELADFVIQASAIYRFDLSQLVAVGYSNGANIAGSLLLSRPEILAGAVLIRAMVPFEPDSKSELTAKRIFISAGRFDPIIPTEQVTRLEEILIERGAQVKVLWNELDHRISRPELEVARDWLAQA